MLEYDPTRPNIFTLERMSMLRSIEPMKISPAVLTMTAEELHRRRLDITRKMNPHSHALVETEMDDARERSAIRVAKGTDKAGIGARLLAKMGFAGKGGIGKGDGEGIATPLVHQGVHGGAPVGVAAVVRAEESAEVRKVYRRIKGRPSPVLVFINFAPRAAVVEDDSKYRQEVFQACSRYGTVKEIQVYVEENDDPYGVRIFARMDKVTAAIRAMETLDGQTFDGRAVGVCFYDENQYEDQIYDDDLT